MLSAALFGLAFGALSLAEDRHDYDIHQRVRTSCAFARSGASIGLKFRAYLVARPTDAGAWMELGKIYQDYGRRAFAQECFDRAS